MEMKETFRWFRNAELSIFHSTRQIFKPFQPIFRDFKCDEAAFICAKNWAETFIINSTWALGDGWRFNDKMSFWFNFFLVLRFVDYVGTHIGM